MFRTIFSVLFKVLLALGGVFAVFAALQYLENRQPDYIEVYNNEDPEGEEY